LGAFGGFRLYRYTENTLSDSDSLEFGGNFNFRVTKWLYLANSASVYVNVSGDHPEQQVYNVQIGGLDFHLSDSWRIWAGAGISIADTEGQIRTTENISGGIGYTAQNMMLSVTYQRGFTSLIGLSELMHTDVVTASLGYRLTRWMSARLESYYYRSTEDATRGVLITLSGGGGLQFALLRSLMLTVNAYYQNQRTRDNFSIEGLGLNRFTGSAGLQYVWPARRGNPDYGSYTF
jgi:opacity protein-like surface antigen